MPKELPKAYEPQQYENDIYDKWEASGYFNPDVCVENTVTEAEAESFSMVLPPPNVTGTLHMGHAVMLALQDIMTRYHRMKGDKTLWLPGTDHAAIATESKVEKLLIENEGMEKPKETLGRADFLGRVDQFAQESHDTIVNQAKKMGSSLDWSREAFTLDETRNKAVRSVFKLMYDQGLIYRGYRVINWSVRGQSTCSDDELEHKERTAMLYTFTYSKDFPIPIATTRPETKVGDTAVAVHPEGKYKAYIGQTFEVPDVGQTGHTLSIKVIGDEHVDEAYGTGALGVTPAHSHVDFEMYQKQKAAGDPIDIIQVIGEDGCMTDAAGDAYAGLTVEEAREKFVAYLREQDLLIDEEEVEQNVGTSDRFKDVVEALPKTQWFIDVNKKFVLPHSEIEGVESGQTVTLKQLMQQVVKSEQIKIVPERFEKTYFHWIDNLRDWCISRQIWYGHQVPVWYKQTTDDGQQTTATYVGIEEPEGDEWEQDPDTLDTWFSAGLWTFSTLAQKPEEIRIEDGRVVIDNQDFADFHPTSVLETGYDILFFWVARMILMTTYATGQVPFETVYLHGLVRDEKGRKMSKSLGNILDPLDMIKKYGTDATRLSLVIGSTPGNDTKLSEEKVAGFRNFTNKLWNISRFIIGKIQETNHKMQMDVPRSTGDTLADKWILGRMEQIVAQVTDDIEHYRFSAAGENLREFTWGELADWYLEIVKIEGSHPSGISVPLKSDILNYILNTLLKLWHPYMPYVTETIWSSVYGDDAMLMVEQWPEVPLLAKPASAMPWRDGEGLGEVSRQFTLIQDIITHIRALRAEKKIDPAKQVGAMLVCEDEQQLLDENAHIIRALARVESMTITGDASEAPEQSASAVVEGVTVHLDLAGSIDVDAERERLQKEIDHVAPYVAQLEKKLANKGFVGNAPEAVVEKEKAKLEEAKQKLTTLEEQLNTLT